jgi:beta-lactamase regulating signal transducer with metallopeptidase domain
MNSDLTPLYLVGGRFLVSATVLLLLGLVGAALLGRKRGPRAAAAVQRAALSAVLASAFLSVLPEAPTLWAVPVTVTSHAEKPTMIRLNVTTAPPVAVAPSQAVPSVAAMPPPAVESRGVDVPAPQAILPRVLALWGIGAMIPLIGLAIGHQALRRMAWGSVSLAADHPAAQMMPALAERLGIPAPEMRLTPDATGPMLTGIRRPTLYLPSDLPLNETELRSALAHELAHMKHRDLLWSLIARLVCAALWFHPLMLLLARRMNDTAEEAADEVAMEISGQRRAYADLLLRLAEQTAPLSERLAPGAGLLSFRSGVGRRILRILLTPAHLSRPLSRPATGIIVAGLAAVTLLCLPALPLVHAREEAATMELSRRLFDRVRAPRNIPQSDAVGCLDARDAPTRLLVGLLFETYRQDFQIDNRVQGRATLKATGYNLDGLLDIVRRSSSVPLEFSTEQNVRIARAPKAPEPLHRPAVPKNKNPPCTIAEVQRRVAAVFYEKRDGVKSRFAAVLITGEDGSAAHGDIVRVGSKVPPFPANSPGSGGYLAWEAAPDEDTIPPTPVVTRINENGLTLKYEENGRILSLEVPLMAIGSRDRLPSPRDLGKVVPPPFIPPAPFPPAPFSYTNQPSVTIDARDAPFRQAMEMLFALERKEFQLDNGLVGYITLKATDQPFDNSLRLVLYAAGENASYTLKQGVYDIRPNDPATVEKSAQQWARYEKDMAERHTPITPLRTVADVPRRVAAIAYRTPGASETRHPALPNPNVQAILVTGVEGIDAVVDVVRIGSRIPSGLPGAPAVRVTDISATGVTLETEDGSQRIFVRLQQIRWRRAVVTPRTTVSESSAP